MKNRKAELSYLEGWHQRKRRGYKERVWEGEYGRTIMYSMYENGKMRPVESTWRSGEKHKRE
jgi:hypothetical protein